jgi:anaphase-promoting complex subunit 10
MEPIAELQAGLRELGAEAVWSLSSAKCGNGVEQLRDESLSTYWQSDGAGPHLINIQFLRKTSVCSVNLYLNYVLDESYTPKRVSVRAGSTRHDLTDVTVVDLAEPSGWVSIELGSQDADTPGPLRTHVLQVRCL